MEEVELLMVLVSEHRVMLLVLVMVCMAKPQNQYDVIEDHHRLGD